MLMVNHLIGFGVGGALIQAAVLGSVGTPIGTMTSGSGLTAGFDGVTNKAYTSCAIYNGGGTVGYLGKDWGAGNAKAICGFKIWGSNDRGYDGQGGTETITPSLLGSNTNDPTTAAVLYTAASFLDNNGTNPKDYSSALLSVASYRYTWVKMLKSDVENPCFAQVEFWELIEM